MDREYVIEFLGWLEAQQQYNKAIIEEHMSDTKPDEYFFGIRDILVSIILEYERYIKYYGN